LLTDQHPAGTPAKTHEQRRQTLQQAIAELDRRLADADGPAVTA
jgi:hypothetical protein